MELQKVRRDSKQLTDIQIRLFMGLGLFECFIISPEICPIKSGCYKVYVADVNDHIGCAAIVNKDIYKVPTAIREVLNGINVRDNLWYLDQVQNVNEILQRHRIPDEIYAKFTSIRDKHNNFNILGFVSKIVLSNELNINYVSIDLAKYLRAEDIYNLQQVCKVSDATLIAYKNESPSNQHEFDKRFGLVLKPRSQP